LRSQGRTRRVPIQSPIAGRLSLRSLPKAILFAMRASMQGTWPGLPGEGPCKIAAAKKDNARFIPYQYRIRSKERRRIYRTKVLINTFVQ
jgi:hypothetical protein